MSVPEPYRRDDGTIMVPRRAESEDGSAVGIGYVELDPSNPQYAEWVEYLAALSGDDDWAAQAAAGSPR